MEYVIDPRETYRVKLIQLDATATLILHVLFPQRSIIGIVSETVKQRTHLHSFCHFLGEKVEKGIGYGVITKVEILQVNAFPCLTYSRKHILKFLSARCQEGYTIIMRERDALFAHNIYDK